MLSVALSLLWAASHPPADIRPILRTQGFPAPLDREHSTINLIGNIKQGSRIYSVYFYEGWFGQAHRGINRILVILDRRTFLGDYATTAARDCRIHGQAVVCKTDYPGNRIQFTKNGPPREIWLDGEILTFTTAEWLRRN